MAQTIDLSKHPFSVRCDEFHNVVGTFTNMDAAVRKARDFSFYQNDREYPGYRLQMHIFDFSTGTIYDQDVIDNRFAQLLEQDVNFV